MIIVKGNNPETWVKPVLGVGNKEKKEQMSSKYKNTHYIVHLHVACTCKAVKNKHVGKHGRMTSKWF